MDRLGNPIGNQVWMGENPETTKFNEGPSLD